MQSRAFKKNIPPPAPWPDRETALANGKSHWAGWQDWRSPAAQLIFTRTPLLLLLQYNVLLHTATMRELELAVVAKCDYRQQGKKEAMLTLPYRGRGQHPKGHTKGKKEPSKLQIRRQGQPSIDRSSSTHSVPSPYYVLLLHT